jgi:hypothetical protein
MGRSILSISFCLLFLSGCIRPWRDFEKYTPPPEPDYSKESAWAALPWKHDSAHAVPGNSNLNEAEDSAKVDVFFIYPTLYYSPKSWNADINDADLNQRIEATTIRQQASVYNGSCKIYAPRYRQATLYSFVDNGDDGKKALDLAYTDVRRAFKYYMQHYNNGRPIIIAGHSQGAVMAYRILKEFFDTTALRKKLVAAYPIGYRIVKDSLKNIPLGSSSIQTGCFITWNTVSWTGLNRKKEKYFKGSCVNPLSWNQDTDYVSKEHNTGSIARSFQLIPGAVGAACHDGALWISNPPAGNGYFALGGSYHIFDYSLFYMNLRANVAQRVKAYMAEHPSK